MGFFFLKNSSKLILWDFDHSGYISAWVVFRGGELVWGSKAPFLWNFYNLLGGKKYELSILIMVHQEVRLGRLLILWTTPKLFNCIPSYTPDRRREILKINCERIFLVILIIIQSAFMMSCILRVFERIFLKVVTNGNVLFQLFNDAD